ncbi:cysteine-rich receptor-like protein kinase 10 isoform X2 [Sorghum bicolor]|uniref:cysteine-rich receptor-like protein kinase 10 isoform X2 n=1 Tax=Sorghum bicolor TaxID=4558 RepID=UPI000B425DD6|nr:cysteine-rich receptor-like protein kinase 10 isoform X2 [Sorghum bicolor]|eukprot:XP_021321441.1 cysteine-rich receptor-like protein kinase 10 isoform X2 [Sorghum bicolor]
MVVVATLVALTLLSTAALQAQPPWPICETSSGNYTKNSTYKANIEYLASFLPQYASSNPNYLFASGSSGISPDVIYAIALCRGDTNASSCATCVAAAIQAAGEVCPLVKTVTIYDDPCIVRFSEQGFPIRPPYDTGMTITWNYENLSAAVAPSFEAATARLVNATVEYAAADQTTRRFGTGEAPFDDEEFPKIYSLAQCTPDMTADQCRSCLWYIIGRFTKEFFAGKKGGRVLGVRCNYRFETYPFFYGRPLLQLQPPNGPSPAPASQATGEGITDNRSKVVAIAVPTIAAVLITFIACWYCLWRRRRLAAKALQLKSTTPDDIESIGSLLLDLSTLRVATGDFSEHKRLGEGGFGVVYKGDLPDGQEIAVKRLAQTSRQGIEELKTELLLVAKLNHNNLVRLIGVCLEENEKILAYEYMPNRSLDTILFDAEKAKELDWAQRFKIISGIARGLQYLHEDSQLKIVHRDLKASNVLLDSAYNPKISDFGLAKIFGRDQSHVVTNRIAGTYGYMSPEYAMRGQCSMKSDVFSFGVLVLEIVTGRRNYVSYNSEQDVDLINLVSTSQAYTCQIRDRHLLPSHNQCVDVFSFGVLVLEIVTGRRNYVSYNSEQDVDLINLIWEHWTRDKAINLIDASLNSNYPADIVLKCIHIGLLCVEQKPTDRSLMSAVNYMLNSNAAACLPPLSRPTIWFRETDDELNPKASISWGRTKTKSSRNEVSITEIESR